VTFSGKIVSITGAVGGVGQALCRHFGGLGAKIAAVDRNPAVHGFIAELAKEGVAGESETADVGEASEIEDALARLAAKLGVIDILVNNAGYSPHPTFAQTDPAGWQNDINGNLNGAYNCAYAVLPGMREKGSGVIINIGSVNALSALGDPAYSAAKAGLVSLTRSLAVEFGRCGIRVNVVLPGTVRTPLWNVRASKDPNVLAKLERWYPMGRIVEPIDVARAVAFLASDDASAITGAALPVDCGLSAGNIVMARELTLENF